MNEELQSALAEMILGAVDAAEAAKGFMAAELPEVINQLLVWKMTDSAIGSLIGVVGLYASWRYWLYYAKGTDPEGWIYKSDMEVPMGFLGVFLSFMSCGIFIVVTLSLDWLQILIAPKVYLIEYIAGLAK